MKEGTEVFIGENFLLPLTRFTEPKPATRGGARGGRGGRGGPRGRGAGPPRGGGMRGGPRGAPRGRGGFRARR